MRSNSWQSLLLSDLSPSWTFPPTRCKEAHSETAQACPAWTPGAPGLGLHETSGPTCPGGRDLVQFFVHIVVCSLKPRQEIAPGWRETQSTSSWSRACWRRGPTGGTSSGSGGTSPVKKLLKRVSCSLCLKFSFPPLGLKAIMDQEERQKSGHGKGKRKKQEVASNKGRDELWRRKQRAQSVIPAPSL